MPSTIAQPLLLLNESRASQSWWRKYLNTLLSHSPHAQNLRKPRRIDKIIVTALVISALYSLALTPLRLAMLRMPLLACGLTASITGLILAGNDIHQAHQSMLWLLLPATLSMLAEIKYLPVWWAIGRFWGDDFLHMIAPENSRALKILRKYEGRGLHYDFMLLVCAHIPFSPLPATWIYLFLGNARVKLWIATLMNIPLMMFSASIYAVLGYYHGKPVADLIEDLSKHLVFISYAFSALIFVSVFRQTWKKRMNNQ